MKPQVEIRRHLPASPWTYPALDAHQRGIASRVREGGPGALLLSEVAPVITMGKRATDEELRMSREDLGKLGISVFPTDRGGLATYHGPGQWVLFPVDDLERLTGDSRGVRKAVEGLLELACDIGRQYEPRAEIRTGCETGVWTPRGKFASVGVHVAQGVVLHGLSVNGFRTPTSFLGLRPCGLEGVQADYLLGLPDLSEPKGKDLEFQELGKKLQEEALRRFW